MTLPMPGIWLTSFMKQQLAALRLPCPEQLPVCLHPTTVDAFTLSHLAGFTWPSMV